MSGGWWSSAAAKTQFLRRLAQRAGHPWPDSDDPPFDFDATQDHWQNLDQLEAVAEFYANFNDPWAAGAQPRRPGDANYITVSLRDPKGEEARITGHDANGRPILTLDGNPDLTRVKVNRRLAPAQGGQPAIESLYDTLWLESDTRRGNHLYRIMVVDHAAHTVTLDPQPPAGGAAGDPVLTDGKSEWRINLRPILVVIDAFGARNMGGVILQGANATVTGQDAAGHAILTLDGNPDISRVNENFDTLYLPSDTTQPVNRPRRTYRIIARNDAADTVTVDGNPVLDNGSSAWHIPAGLSGEMLPLNYNIAPPQQPAARAARGHDHFDGMMFVVQSGRVRNRFRWNSYTSRDWGPWNDPNWNQFRSSLRGNRLYHFSSFRSANDFRNYSYAVVDVCWSNDGIRPVNYDGVFEARRYFETPVTDDSVPIGNNPANDPQQRGKTDIRLHHSLDQGAHCNSAGCVVSPLYDDLRTALIDLYQAEYAAFNGPGAQDAEVQKAHSQNLQNLPAIPGNPNPTLHDRSRQLYNTNVNSPNGLSGRNWNDKMVGTLWVIRPDERPI